MTITLCAAVPGADASPRPYYVNPISAYFADTFADPAVIHAKDGWWYAYSTADPLRSGDEPGIMHIARTRDFVDWDYQGTVFDEKQPALLGDRDLRPLGAGHPLCGRALPALLHRHRHHAEPR